VFDPGFIAFGREMERRLQGGMEAVTPRPLRQFRPVVREAGRKRDIAAGVAVIAEHAAAEAIEGTVDRRDEVDGVTGRNAQRPDLKRPARGPMRPLRWTRPPAAQFR